jgi:hypothetical protein
MCMRYMGILIFENSFVVLEIFDFGPCEPITHRSGGFLRTIDKK